MADEIGKLFAKIQGSTSDGGDSLNGSSSPLAHTPSFDAVARALGGMRVDRDILACIFSGDDSVLAGRSARGITDTAADAIKSLMDVLTKYNPVALTRDAIDNAQVVHRPQVVNDGGYVTLAPGGGYPGVLYDSSLVSSFFLAVVSCMTGRYPDTQAHVLTMDEETIEMLVRSDCRRLPDQAVPGSVIHSQIPVKNGSVRGKFFTATAAADAPEAYRWLQVAEPEYFSGHEHVTILLAGDAVLDRAERDLPPVKMRIGSMQVVSPSNARAFGVTVPVSMVQHVRVFVPPDYQVLMGWYQAGSLKKSFGSMEGYMRPFPQYLVQSNSSVVDFAPYIVPPRLSGVYLVPWHASGQALVHFSDALYVGVGTAEFRFSKPQSFAMVVEAGSKKKPTPVVCRGPEGRGDAAKVTVHEWHTATNSAVMAGAARTYVIDDGHL